MRVTVVGSGDAFGSGGRFQTCFALAAAADERPGVLVDCGATSLVALRRAGIDPNDVHTVVLTHLHGDHFGGLPFLVLDGQFRHRAADLTIVGPPGTGDRLTAAMETLFPGSSTVRRRFAVTVREHRAGHGTALPGLDVVPFEVRHAAGAPAYAVRVEVAGKVFAYTGDTEWTDVLPAVADEADLFLAEGYSPTPVRWHLDLGSLSRHRDELTCRRLLLTHLSPTALAADLGAWDVAEDGLCLDV